jgi:hypothetical protein
VTYLDDDHRFMDPRALEDVVTHPYTDHDMIIARETYNERVVYPTDSAWLQRPTFDKCGTSGWFFKTELLGRECGWLLDKHSNWLAAQTRYDQAESVGWVNIVTVQSQREKYTAGGHGGRLDVDEEAEYDHEGLA